MITLKLDECERQLVLMALAHLAVERPGWDYATQEIAKKMDNPLVSGGTEMFCQFKTMRDQMVNLEIDLSPEIRNHIQEYVQQGIPPGDFLRAVYENNLREAFGRADERNRRSLFQIVSYLYQHVPNYCWGSPERVEAWIKMHKDALEQGSRTKVAGGGMQQVEGLER